MFEDRMIKLEDNEMGIDKYKNLSLFKEEDSRSGFSSAIFLGIVLGLFAIFLTIILFKG